MKNLMLPNGMLETAEKNLNGEDFKDLILKVNDYFLNGVEPEFDGIKKIIFDLNKPFFDYMTSKYDKRVSDAMGLQTVDDMRF